jgi:maltoporin
MTFARKFFLISALVLASQATHADPGTDKEGFHGYFRAGAGINNAEGGRQGCFGLGGNSMRYRLGNECDAYFEGGYTQNLLKAEGVTFTGTLWLQAYAPNSDFGNNSTSISKAYVEAKGLDFLSGGVAWIGKRHYVRPDIHMLDLQFINLNGTGGGVDKMDIGPGKLSVAVFKDNDNTVPGTGGAIVGSTAALRTNFVYEGLPTNENGGLDLVAGLIKAEGSGRHNGWNITAVHRQNKVLGGANALGLQYGVGPGTGVGTCCSRIGASGDTSLGSDVTRLRVFDSLWLQPSDAVAAELVVLHQRDRSKANGTSTWTTVGARPVWSLHRNFKLQGEVGVSRVTQPGGAPNLSLTKVTIAPTISAGPGYFQRPELRLFVTHGRWNRAATAAVNASNEGGPIYGNRTSATSAGLQVEVWF